VNWDFIVWVIIAALFAIGLGLFVGAILKPSVTKFDFFSKTKRFDLSVGQLQKIYDWKISQYSNTANAFLSALAGFVGSVVLEEIKNSSFNAAAVLYVGVAATLCLWVMCHLEVRALRNGFFEGYKLVERLTDLPTESAGKGTAAS
jgi:Na+/H+-dicarboxylate symporter